MKKLTKTFKNFLRDGSGAFTIQMGLLSVGIILGSGAAIDTARIARESASYRAALDSAALALGADDRADFTGLTGTNLAARKALLNTMATDYVKQNYNPEIGRTVNVSVTADIIENELILKSDHSFPTTIMGLVYEGDFTFNFKSSVKMPQGVELVMVLDTTGSMKADMAGAVQAAKDLLAELYADSGSTKNMSHENIRVAMVPFSAAIRLDKNAHDFDLDWIDTTGANPLSKLNFDSTTWHNYMAWGKLKNGSSALSWNGCVESRKIEDVNGVSLQSGDVAPSSSDGKTQFPAFFNPDGPSGYSNISNNYTFAYSYDDEDDIPSTGYDNSGNINSFDGRFKNRKKYDGTNIGDQVFTAMTGSDAGRYSSNVGPWVGCTASAIVPMTFSRDKVEKGLDKIKAYGGTNIAEGIAWGMRVISPGQPFTKVEGYGSIPNATIAPYKVKSWKKIIVLMSDGENDPYFRFVSDGSIAEKADTGTGYGAYGASTVSAVGLNRFGSTNINLADDHLDSVTNQVCSDLKSNSVEIYAVGFRVNPTILQNCATSVATHYRTANNVDELKLLFKGIGARARHSLYLSQ